jgi:hypothetical protein
MHIYQTSVEAYQCYFACAAALDELERGRNVAKSRTCGRACLANFEAGFLHIYEEFPGSAHSAG